MDERSNLKGHSKLKGPQANLTGFLVPDSSDDEGAYASPGFMSPSYAAASPGFSSLDSAAYPDFMSPSSSAYPSSAAYPDFMSLGSAAYPSSPVRDDLDPSELNSYLVPEYWSSAALPSSAAATGFGSPASAGFVPPNATDICTHRKRSDSCKDCFIEFNEDRKLKGLPPIGRGYYCKHGTNKYKKTNKCPYPECNEKRPYTKTFAPPSAEEPQPLYQHIPESARTQYPPIPQNFSHGGGRRKYRKSSKKSKRKSSKKSKRKSYRKARKSLKR
jgi:hypothetical protein